MRTHGRLILIFLQAALGGWGAMLFLALAIACLTLGYVGEGILFAGGALLGLALGLWRWWFIRRQELVLTRLGALILYPSLFLVFTVGTFLMAMAFQETVLERNRLHFLILAFGWFPVLPLLVFLAEFKTLPDDEPVPDKVV
ncbi:MAG: hypothetical protein ACFE0O_06960 [Opitutales bacterium]